MQKYVLFAHCRMKEIKLNSKINNFQPKIKCLILEMIEIIDSIKTQMLNIKYEETSNAYSQLAAYPIISSTRKSSGVSNGVRSRKSSINPKDVEYVRRSRFNSIADELKISKEDNRIIFFNNMKFIIF